MTTPQGAMILVAEDDPDQREIVTACLEGEGYVTFSVVSGDFVVDVARAEKPSLILLDVSMPGLDGYAACRLLKADPELADIPVIFMTTRASLDDRIAGLTLGADEFLSKPVDLRELVLRIQILLKRSQAHPSPEVHEPAGSKQLTYDAFLAVATEEIGRSPAALAIVRFPTKHRKEGSLQLTGEIRGRDAIGAYGSKCLLILMPEMTAAAARDWLEPVVDRLAAHGLDGIQAGVTANESAGARTPEALIGEAEHALAEARSHDKKTAVWGERSGRPATVPVVRTVIIADDDPLLSQIIDAAVSAAGYQAIIALDGEQALAAVREHKTSVLVLDLMMPKVTGFDVLAKLDEIRAPWPRILVLSGRGQEKDVMRAFELGADDYMTKPFDPPELIVRIAGLFA